LSIPEAVLRFINYRDRSTEEIRRYVRRKSICAEPEIGALIQKLLDSGFADDRRFTENRIAYRIAGGYGPYHIARELAGLGITSELYRDNLARMEEAFIAGARKYAASLARTITDSVKLERRLLGRGYATSQVKAALKSEDSV